MLPRDVWELTEPLSSLELHILHRSDPGRFRLSQRLQNKLCMDVESVPLL